MELRSYTPEDLGFLAEEAAKVTPKRLPKKGNPASTPEASGEAPAPDDTPKKKPVPHNWTPGSFDRIVLECRFIRHWVDDASGLPEPEWFAGISIVARCADGHDLVQKYSSLDHRYDEGETEAKIDHALENAGPRTCANIFKWLGFAGCQQCAYRRYISSPIQIGYVAPGGNHVGA